MTRDARWHRVSTVSSVSIVEDGYGEKCDAQSPQRVPSRAPGSETNRLPRGVRVEVVFTPSAR